MTEVLTYIGLAVIGWWVGRAIAFAHWKIHRSSAETIAERLP